MPRTFRRVTRLDLARKRCLRCGYDGAALQDGSIEFMCPHCGQDLYARPPRSYLELEGLLSPPIRPNRGRGMRLMLTLLTRLIRRVNARAAWPRD